MRNRRNNKITIGSPTNARRTSTTSSTNLLSQNNRSIVKKAGNKLMSILPKKFHSWIGARRGSKGAIGDIVEIGAERSTHQMLFWKDANGPKVYLKNLIPNNDRLKAEFGENIQNVKNSADDKIFSAKESFPSEVIIDVANNYDESIDRMVGNSFKENNGDDAKRLHLVSIEKDKTNGSTSVVYKTSISIAKVKTDFENSIKDKIPREVYKEVRTVLGELEVGESISSQSKVRKDSDDLRRQIEELNQISAMITKAEYGPERHEKLARENRNRAIRNKEPLDIEDVEDSSLKELRKNVVEKRDILIQELQVMNTLESETINTVAPDTRIPPVIPPDPGLDQPERTVPDFVKPPSAEEIAAFNKRMAAERNGNQRVDEAESEGKEKTTDTTPEPIYAGFPSLDKNNESEPDGDKPEQFGKLFTDAELESKVTLESIPPSRRWKLFIDKDRQIEGEDTFDKKEPGYKNAMTKALDHVQATMSQRLDADGFIQLHDLAVDGVTNDREEAFKKGLHKGSQNYGFAAEKKPTESSLKELQEEGVLKDIAIKTDDTFDSVLLMGRVYSVARDEADAKKRINEHLNTYYSELSKANTENDKVKAIVKVARALEVGHYFADGNQRTVVFLMLNKFLMENDMLPVIMENPTAFDGYLTIDQLVAEVYRGQRNFLEAKDW